MTSTAYEETAYPFVKSGARRILRLLAVVNPYRLLVAKEKYSLSVYLQGMIITRLK